MKYLSVLALVMGLMSSTSDAWAAAGCSLRGASYSANTYVCDLSNSNGNLYMCTGTQLQSVGGSSGCCCGSSQGIGGSCSSNSTGGGCAGVAGQNTNNTQSAPAEIKPLGSGVIGNTTLKKRR